MKILLTGATGHLGLAAAKALSEAGHEVIGIDRIYRPGFPGRLLLMDLREETAPYGPVEGCAAVVHLGNVPNVHAGPTPQSVYRDNAAINANVFQAARDIGVPRVLFASSIQVISGKRSQEEPSRLPYFPLDGRVPPNPGNLYAHSKVAAEALMRFYAEEAPETCWVAVRFPWLVTAEYLKYFRPGALTDRKYYGMDEAFSYLTLDDGAALLRRAVERTISGFHILLPAARGNSRGLPADEVARRWFANVPIRTQSGRLETLVDTSEIERLFGWTPKDNYWFDPPAQNQRA